jgi:pantoate--beta-alanine ligase
MMIARTISDVRRAVKAWRKEGLTIGLVPTMGYLHEGHASLVKAAKASCDRVVVSVFVNPTQFGPNEDLESYPRDFEHDCTLLEGLGTDLVFHPDPAELYFPDAATWVEVPALAKNLCAKTRPTHFRGVCTVVSKLFHIAAPDKAFFGQKDAQQLAVIRRMVRDLNFDLEIVGCPIVREADGLAKSSRNTYLNPKERQAALILNRSLKKGEALIEAGETDTGRLLAVIKESISTEPLATLDYAEAVDADSMKPVATVEGNVLFAIAVYIGKTRLIDNFVVSR